MFIQFNVSIYEFYIDFSLAFFPFLTFSLSF